MTGQLSCAHVLAAKPGSPKPSPSPSVHGSSTSGMPSSSLSGSAWMIAAPSLPTWFSRKAAIVTRPSSLIFGLKGDTRLPSHGLGSQLSSTRSYPSSGREPNTVPPAGTKDGEKRIAMRETTVTKFGLRRPCRGIRRSRGRCYDRS